MAYTLANDQLKIKVTKVGAELASLVHRESGREYIWQADPAVWGSHAPVLFPIIGVLKGGSTTIDGEEYRIPKHGFVRHNERLELYSKLEDRLTLRLCWSEETLAMFPYKFDFRITYRLRNEHLIVYHEVHNVGDEPMHFCLGGHPAFRVPFFAGDTYADNLLRFEHPENSGSYTVTEAGTLTRDQRPVPWAEGGTVLPLTHELFDNDALVFDDLATRSIVLESRTHGPWLKVDYAGWTHLGIWAKPTGDFVCIEPWMGLSDFVDSDGHFATKPGLVELGANAVYEMSYDLKVL